LPACSACPYRARAASWIGWTTSGRPGGHHPGDRSPEPPTTQSPRKTARDMPRLGVLIVGGRVGRSPTYIRITQFRGGEASGRMRGSGGKAYSVVLTGWVLFIDLVAATEITSQALPRSR